MSESQLQSKIIKWLKFFGCYVVKTRPQPGTPTGCPDIIALSDLIWIVIEVKASATSPFRVGQETTLDFLRKRSSLVYVVNPENWELVKADIYSKAFKNRYL